MVCAQASDNRNVWHNFTSDGRGKLVEKCVCMCITRLLQCDVVRGSLLSFGKFGVTGHAGLAFNYSIVADRLVGKCLLAYVRTPG